MSVLAIIPARGGSKSIPRKNIKLLNGQPLIAWTIEAARQAEFVDRIVVSTDDDEIAATARQFGAEVVMRPADISGDLASSESALLHVLQTLGDREDYVPDIVAFLQCTAPLMLPDDIDSTVHQVLQESYDSAVTMTPFHHFVWSEDEEGRMTGVNHTPTLRLMRQQRKPQFLEVGAVYAMRTNGFLENGFRFFGRIGRHKIPSLRALEIDEPGDWPLAEALMRTLGKSREKRLRPSRWSGVKAVVTDFDGVMTDNRVHVDQEGREAVVCNRADGWGISLLREAKISVACISTEANPVVSARCEKLGIPYWQGQEDKLSALQAFLDEEGIEPQDCLYVGNDTNDARCLEFVGLAVVPQDAAPVVTPLADWQTEAAGGDGVLREIASLILERSSRE
jgi:N-acylneuraminate cytidylyltransferase